MEEVAGRFGGFQVSRVSRLHIHRLLNEDLRCILSGHDTKYMGMRRLQRHGVKKICGSRTSHAHVP